MALWQFRLDLIPEKVLRTKYGILPLTISEDNAENYPWWADVQPPAGLDEQIDTILPRASTWSVSMRIWGDEHGDTASVCYDNKSNVEWIGFRVDVRDLSFIFISNICTLAKNLNCLLLTNTYQLIVPDDSTVVAAINRSTAKKYLDNPVSTLRNLKKKRPHEHLGN